MGIDNESGFDEEVFQRACAEDDQHGSPLLGGEEVQFYSHHARALKYSQRYKIEKLFEHNCIEYIAAAGGNPGFWLIHPIPGYNKRCYRVEREKDVFVCNCQCCQTLLKKGQEPMCAHIGAVYEWLKRRNMAIEEPRYEQALITGFQGER